MNGSIAGDIGKEYDLDVTTTAALRADLNIDGVTDIPQDVVHFSLASLQALEDAEDRHFWPTVKRYLITSLLARTMRKAQFRCIDIGCGNGGLIRGMEAAFPEAEVAGMDGHLQALVHCRRRSARSALYLRDITQLEPSPQRRYDAIILADVLEHLDDPAALLHRLQGWLTEDGVIIATVPAHPSLWSSRDDFLGHRRRYTRSAFRDLFVHAGYTVDRINHLYSYLYLPALLHRKFFGRTFGKSGAAMEASELRTIPVLNGLVTLLGKSEAFLSLHCPLPFGSSVYCTAHHPSSPSSGLQ